MKEIALTNGGTALVDDEDFESLNRFKWRRSDQGKGHYAVRNEGVYKLGTFKLILMHRAIKDAQKGQILDHINGNGLDNRKDNLRFCTHAQNMQNQRSKNVAGTSRYKGVHWHPRGNSWRARIVVNKKSISGGCYAIEADAAKAYDALAAQHFGEFARLNFPSL